MIKPNIEIVNVVKSCEMLSQMIWNKVVTSDPGNTVNGVFIDKIKSYGIAAVNTLLGAPSSGVMELVPIIME